MSKQAELLDLMPKLLGMIDNYRMAYGHGNDTYKMLSQCYHLLNEALPFFASPQPPPRPLSIDEASEALRAMPQRKATDEEVEAVMRKVIAASPAPVETEGEEWPDGLQEVTLRKRPVNITAIRFHPENLDACCDFCGGNYEYERGPNVWGEVIYIETLEGKMRAVPGDWIIKGVKGEFYPVKDDIISATYEVVAPAPSPSPEEEVRPPMLKAKPLLTDAWKFWTYAGGSWHSERLCGVQSHVASELLIVDRNASDPAALKIYDAETARAEGT